jgi:hypothetical protein
VKAKLLPPPPELEGQIRRLLGLPPYDQPSNICWEDAYYAKSLEQKYGKTIDELRRWVGL